MKQNELINIIEKGVEKLEKIADVKWLSRGNLSTKEKLVSATTKAITNNTNLYTELGYRGSAEFCRAINKVITSIPIEYKQKRKKWKNLILEIVGYKQCNKCNEVKLLDNFSVGQTYCKKCSSETTTRWNQENKEYREVYITNYRNENKEKIAEKNKVYRENNKEKIKEQSYNRRKETTLHIINVMIREGKIKEAECKICGYKENWAALEFHHIDSELERPEWAYNKDGSKKTPSNYIMSVSKNLAEERYLVEIDNLELLCTNCHMKHHSTSSKDNQEGIKQVIKEFSCEKCNETEHLHLHHNNPEEKEYSFRDFLGQSKERILQEGLLGFEMTKDVSVLCSNHHREIHNPQWEMINIINSKEETI